MSMNHEQFFMSHWEMAYAFWHAITDRSESQIQILREQLASFDKDRVSILDVGCGAGNEMQRVLSSIEGKQFEITANDISLEALELYRKNNDHYVRRSLRNTLEELPHIISDHFDLILLSHCLYHVELKHLVHFYETLLSPQGIMLVFLDSAKGDLMHMRKHFWREVHSADFDEHSAEDVANVLAERHIPYQEVCFSYHLYLDRLQHIKANGLKTLYIPFAFRTRSIQPSLSEKIAIYTETLASERKIKNYTSAFIIRNKAA